MKRKRAILDRLVKAAFAAFTRRKAKVKSKKSKVSVGFGHFVPSDPFEVFYESVILALLLLLLVPASARAGTVDRIVAVVNDEPITLSELERRSNPALWRMVSPEPFPAGDEKRRARAVLDDLITRRLMVQKAREMRIEAEKRDVDAYIDGMTKSNGLDEKRFAAMLADLGIAMADLRRAVAENIARSRLVHFEVRSRIVITAKEAKERYKKDYKAEKRPQGYHLLQMGFYWNRPHSLADTRAQAEKRAREARARVEAGAGFRGLARRLSELPTADSGGDLGFIRRKEMAPWMLAALEGVKAGGLTPVVEGAGAMQFFLVLEINTPGRYQPPPFRLVEEEIKRELAAEKEKKSLVEWLTKMKKEAYIKVML